MKRSRRLPRILLLLASLAGVIARPAWSAEKLSGATARVFKAGAATSNITPPLGLALAGVPNAPVAGHVHDELQVRCLALDDGVTRLAFAVVDNVSVNREVFDEARRQIRAATGLPFENVMMSATHTHSAVSARGDDPMVFRQTLDAYQTFLARRIADGVRRALHHLEPARIGWGAGQVPQHVFNRRWVLKDGASVVNPLGGRDRAVMNPGGDRDRLLKPAGPTNPEIYILSVQSTTGRPIALLANYWLHYVGGTGGAQISADYFGAFADRIQELLGADRQDPPFVGLLANGPCGDVSNVNFAPGAPVSPKRAPYEKIREVANDVAQEALRLHRSLPWRDWVELNVAAAELPLAMRRPTPEMIDRAQKVLARAATASPVQRSERVFAERTLVAKDWPETVSILLQAFRIGGLGVAAVPFEAFSETGLEIKARSPFRDTFTVELANGGYGYLPTPEQHELGGYETWLGSNRVEKEATRKIVAKLLELFAAVQESPPVGARNSGSASRR